MLFSTAAPRPRRASMLPCSRDPCSQVCRALRDLYPSACLPVIMVSAKGKEDDVVQGACPRGAAAPSRCAGGEKQKLAWRESARRAGGAAAAVDDAAASATVSLMPCLQRGAGLSEGANDYVVKPYGRKELLARIQAHLRYRASAMQAAASPTSAPGARFLPLPLPRRHRPPPPAALVSRALPDRARPRLVCCFRRPLAAQSAIRRRNPTRASWRPCARPARDAACPPASSPRWKTPWESRRRCR